MTQQIHTTPLVLRDVFQQLGPDSHCKHRWTRDQQNALIDIATCRTAIRGGHVWTCDQCCKHVPMYNSCLNRHCPSCQGTARYQWVEARTEDLLDTPYFHVVFTLPHELNPLVALNPKPLLNLLFRAASQTLLQFGRDPEYLGGQLGFFAVLHTWNQKLERHYHLHCIVPGGAWNAEENHWVPCESSRYLFPIHALSRTFRRLFWHGSTTPPGAKPLIGRVSPFQGLNQLLNQGKLTLPDHMAHHSNPIGKLANQLYRKPWHVYAKAPFAGPEQVLKYLGAYTHRVAISNNRLLSLENGMVTFTYKKRRKNAKALTRTKTLPLARFVDLFLKHVLPSGFMKIRHYGFLASRYKKKNLDRVARMVGRPNSLTLPSLKEESVTSADREEPVEVNDSSPVCPFCGCKRLTLLENRARRSRATIRLLYWDTS